MKLIIVFALILAAVVAKAAWEDLPATGSIEDRRGEGTIHVGLAPSPGGWPGGAQMTIPQRKPNAPWAPVGAVSFWSP